MGNLPPLRNHIGPCCKCGNPVFHTDVYFSVLGPDLRYRFEHKFCSKASWTKVKPMWDNILKRRIEENTGDPFNK